MKLSKNEGIQKDDNDKDKQYQKREDMIFSYFRKLRKIELWTYIAYVIVLTIFFVILGFSGHKNWSDISFPPDILVSYVAFEIY